jgi:GT2 family glycosyltransferase
MTSMDNQEGDGVITTVVPGFVDGQEWAACFGLSWADLLLHDQAGPGRIIRQGGQYLREVAGTMGVAAARNSIARAFLANTDGDWLFMVDTDMGFAPDTVDRLAFTAAARKAEVVGALAFCQKRDTDLAAPDLHATRLRIQPTIYEFTEVEETGEKGFRSIGKYRRDQYQTVAATGAACLLISRKVLAKVGPDPFQPITIQGAGGNGTDRTFSEDLSFCLRVQAQGFEIGVDSSIKTTHYKGGIFLDETTYAMQEETLIQAKGHEIARRAELYLNNGLFVPRGAI